LIARYVAVYVASTARHESGGGAVVAARDVDAAKAKAAARVDSARRIASAVDEFHKAADEIEHGHSLVANATKARSVALRSMRDAGLSIHEIAELTSLSPSRVQALVREELERHPEGG
jgi:ribosomal protein S11